jgi:plasmid maintenance system antidote protein VapI
MALRIEKAFGVSMDTLLRLQAWHCSQAICEREDELDVRRDEPV